MRQTYQQSSLESEIFGNKIKYSLLQFYCQRKKQAAKIYQSLPTEYVNMCQWHKMLHQCYKRQIAKFKSYMTMDFSLKLKKHMHVSKKPNQKTMPQNL